MSMSEVNRDHNGGRECRSHAVVVLDKGTMCVMQVKEEFCIRKEKRKGQNDCGMLEYLGFF